MKVGDRTEKVRFFHCYKRGVDRVFVDHPWFLEKVGIFLIFSTIYSLLCFQILISVTELQGMGENWTKTLWTNYWK